MKKLLLTFCMLLVAAFLLTGTTFAWFTMNNTVTAQGMQVKAEASGGIVIQVWDEGSDPKGWTDPGTTATAYRSTTAVTIEPTSTIDLENWFSAEAASVSDEAKKSGNYTACTIKDDYSSAYYLYNKFQIKTSSSENIANTDLVISALTLTQPEQKKSTNLNKAIRVGILVTNDTDGDKDFEDETGVAYFFAPAYASTEAYPNGGVASNTATSLTELSHKSVAFTSPTTIEISADTVYALTQVEIFVYYDGEDANCFTNNTLDGIDSLNVTVQFKTIQNIQNN